MTKAQILMALEELNKELKEQAVRGELCIMGGAVMCLVFNSRESTQDIDAIMAPSAILQKAAFNVSQVLNLNNNFWLNDAVKVFNSENAEFDKSTLSLSHLNILTASPEYMFAMKALSARSGTNDENDLLFLKNNMKSIHEYIKKAQVSTEQRKIWVGQFIDDFSGSKNLEMIQNSLSDTEDPIAKLFEAMAHQLCLNLNLVIPDWLLKPKYLKDPFFVSDLKNSKFLALRDSPYAFRIRNIFVPHHYLSRY